MDLQMNGKTALVTGASAGIGKAIAFALAREGVDVAICARREEPLEAAASQIARETNRKVVTVPADLTKPADAETFVKKAHSALGRVDILVNNAGSSPGGVLEFLTEEHWAQSLQLKFMGYVRCLKHVLPIMQKQGRGRIVNLIGNDGSNRLTGRSRQELQMCCRAKPDACAHCAVRQGQHQLCGGQSRTDPHRAMDWPR